MRVLILGGTGFIGPAVVRQLAERGNEITVYHRGKTQADLPNGVRRLLGERSELPGRRDELARLAPEVVLDMRPMTEAEARTAMSAFTGIARRIVAISSGDVYRAYGRLIGTEPGPLDPVPLTEGSPLRDKLYPYRGETPRAEDDPRRWTDDYDKVLVERAVLGEPALPGTVLRLPATYGPRDGQHRLFEYLKRMDDGRPAILLDEGLAGWRWMRGYVENVAEAIALAIVDERAAGRVYNVAEEVAYSEAEWARRIAEAAGWRGEIVALPRERLPKHLIPDLNTAQALTMDSSRIRAELGYRESVALDEALRRAVAWERANPPGKIDAAPFDYAAEDAALAAM
jgi:nucleoside-diphosphate-sugar epimerase